MLSRLLVCTCIQGLHGNLRTYTLKVVGAETLLVFIKTTLLREHKVLVNDL